MSRDTHINKATVGWCGGPALQCPYVVVNESVIVNFQNYLLVTKNSEILKTYLQSYSNTSISLITLKTILEDQFNGYSISIPNKQDYVLTEGGAVVCYDELQFRLP